MHFGQNRLIFILWKIFSLPTKKVVSTTKIVPVKCIFMSIFIGWISRNGLKTLCLNSVHSDITCAIDGYFCILVKFLVLIQVSVVIMVRYSENLLCFAICDIYISGIWETGMGWIIVCIYCISRFIFIKSKKFR